MPRALCKCIGTLAERLHHIIQKWGPPEGLAQLHIDGAAASDDIGVLQRAPHDHDGVVQRAVCLVQEL